MTLVQRDGMKRKLVMSIVGLTAAVLAGMAIIIASNQFTRPPGNIGARDGRLSDLPSTPNCVSSQTSDASRKMPSLPLPTHSESDPLQMVRRVVEAMPNAVVVTSEPEYLHAEFRTPVLRFVDDVEFLAVPAEGIIHFRSASRVGHSDFGVNRRRMETIRAALQNQ